MSNHLSTGFRLSWTAGDQYETTKACCEFIFSRLAPGGIIVIDDYGRPGTPGAKFGADEIFATKNLRPVTLSTGQAVIVK